MAPWAYGFGSPFASIAYNSIVVTPKLAHVVFPCKSLLRVHSTGQTLVRTWTACAWVAPWAYGFRSPFASTAYNSIAVTPKLAYVVFPLEKCSICVSIKINVPVHPVRTLLERQRHGRRVFHLNLFSVSVFNFKPLLVKETTRVPAKPLRLINL